VSILLPLLWIIIVTGSASELGEKIDYFSIIPPNLIANILSFCSIEDNENFFRVNRMARKFAKSELYHFYNVIKNAIMFNESKSAYLGVMLKTFLDDQSRQFRPFSKNDIELLKLAYNLVFLKDRNNRK